ncbi:MAG: SAM-dependent methyltransferase [Wenzhouxiangellaceae bacterium]
MPVPHFKLPPPPPELEALSLELCTRLAATIGTDGPMPFSEYMRRVLYEPGLGYYTGGLIRFGEAGDFITAPELGTLFAQAIARALDPLAQRLGPDWCLLELGPGSGALACALLEALEHPPRRYWLLEPSAALREVQQQRMQMLPDSLKARVQWLDTPPGEAWTGVVLANEVIDALPVERFKVGASGPERLAVDWDGTRFAWTTLPPDDRLLDAYRQLEQTLGRSLPETYQSELCVDLTPWMRTVLETLERGLALFIDYGYTAQEYYHPQRDGGTLVCHYRHRAHFDPFAWPGLTDVSAWVDFSAAARAGQAAGFDLAGYTTQAAFVLESGVGEQLAGIDDPRQRLALANELKQLVLPGQMGEKFKLLALTRQLDTPIHGFSTFDQRHRL